MVEEEELAPEEGAKSPSDHVKEIGAYMGAGATVATSIAAVTVAIGGGAAIGAAVGASAVASGVTALARWRGKRQEINPDPVVSDQAPTDV